MDSESMTSEVDPSTSGQVPPTSQTPDGFTPVHYGKRRRTYRKPNNFTPIATHNQYDTLSDTSGDEIEIGKKKALPPIVLHGMLGEDHKTTMIELENGLTESFELKYKGSRVLIYTKNITDYSKLKENFLEQKIPFHTFTPDEQKPVKLVLKSIPPNVTAENIIEDLKSKGLEVRKAIQMVKKQPEGTADIKYPMYKVEFAPTTKIATVVKHNQVCRYKVKWEKLRGTDSTVTQCYNCQNFGHIAPNCHIDPRCMFCSKKHGKNECGEPEQLKCANCNGNHSANDKVCEIFQQQVQIKNFELEKRRNRINREYQYNERNFPQLPAKPNVNRTSGNPWTAKTNAERTQPNNGETFTSIWREIKEIFGQFDLMAIIPKLKEFFTQFRLAPDSMSKMLIIGEALFSFFDNGS